MIYNEQKKTRVGATKDKHHVNTLTIKKSKSYTLGRQILAPPCFSEFSDLPNFR